MAQPAVNTADGGDASDGDDGDAGVVALPGQWLSKLTQPDKLDLSVDRGASFRAWKTRWTDFCTLSGLSSQRKKVQLAMLRSCLSDDTIRIVENMGLSESEQSDISVIVERLERHAVGQVSQVMQRRAFNLRIQQAGESFDDYVTCLRDLSQDCGFCNSCRDSLIRDRIVVGICDSTVIRRLCAIQNLTLDEAIQICRSEECAARDASKITDSEAGPGVAAARRGRSAGPPPGAVGRGSRDQRSGRDVTDCGRPGSRPAPTQPRWPAPGPAADRRSRDRPADACRRCGRARCRGETSCPAFDSECFRCGDYGHWGRVCDRRPQRSRTRANAVSFDNDGTMDSNTQISTVTVNSACYRSAPMVQVDVSGTQRRRVRALPDTGADISLAGPEFAEIFGPDRITPPSVHPTVVDGRDCKTIGMLKVRIRLGKIEVADQIHIVPGVNRLILSWQTTQRLGLIPPDYPQQRNVLVDADEDVSAASATCDRDRSCLQEQHLPTPCPALKEKAGKSQLALEEPSGGSYSAREERSGAPQTEQEVQSGAPQTEQEEQGGTLQPPAARQLNAPLNQLVKDYSDVFCEKINMMPGEQFKINLVEGAQPHAVHAPRRIPFALREPLKKELDKLERDGMIVPVTAPTEYCAPIVVAPKKDGGIRMCIDFTKLNKSVRRELYQSNTPAECVASIVSSAAKWFSVFDAAKGYHQCPLEEQSRPLTTFITPFGRYMWTRAPFGISSISEFFNRRMDECFRDIPGIQRVVDDVLICGATKEELDGRVRLFLDRCRARGVTLNMKKAQHMQPEVRFAGFMVTPDGYRMDPDLLRAIAAFPAPRTLTDLRSFFGLVNQVAPFSEEVAHHLEPLRHLLSTKRSFSWDSCHQVAFDAARLALSSTRTLAYFDPTRPTLLSTDASRLHGLGFILQQKQPDGEWRVIQAGSRSLTDAETRYATIELELLAVAWAVSRKCRLFLNGMQHFDILTDHRPLINILNSKNMDEIENPRLQRLRERISMYNFSAAWRRGKDHQAADALSRSPVESPTTEDELAEDNSAVGVSTVICSALKAANTDLRIDDVRRAADRDEEARQLLQTVLDGFPACKVDLPEIIRPYWAVQDRLTVEDGVVLCGCRLVIPRPMRAEVLAELHASHMGKEKTKNRARQVVYWPGMDNDIENITRQCKPCQMELPSLQKETYLRRDPPTRPFQHLCTDLFQHAGHYFMIVVDVLSGWQFCHHLGREATSSRVIAELKSIFCTSGAPEKIFSDGGPQYSSHAFQMFMDRWKVEHIVSSPHYPQSNGRAEAGVKAASKLIRRCWTASGGLDVEAWTRGVLQQRNTPGPDGRSPAMIVFGRPVRDTLPAHRRSFDPHWQRTADEADAAATRLREDAERRYNQHARDLPGLRVGSQVMVQNHVNKRWDRCGVVTEVDHSRRRYFVRLPSGRVLTRNRRFLRQRYAYAEPPQSSHPPADSQPALKPAAAERQLRRSSRIRRRPRRLIEEM